MTAHFNYALAFAGILADFPQLRGNTFFMNAAATEFAKSILADGTLGQNAAAMKEARPWLKIIYDNRDVSTSTAHSVKKNGHPYHCLMISPDSIDRALDNFSDKITREMQIYYDLDHELGHLVVPYAMSQDRSNTYVESAADAYAMIRHIQRFGADTGFLAATSWQRAANYVYGMDKYHMTSNVIDKILADSRTKDFKRLSPEQTVDLARKYAAENKMGAQTVNRSYKELNGGGIKGLILSRLSRHAYIRSIGDTCLATSDKFAFQVGLRMFQPYLDDGGAEFRNKKVKFSDEKRAAYKDALRQKAEELGLTDIFNLITEKKMPAVSSAPQPFSGNRLKTSDGQNSLKT